MNKIAQFLILVCAVMYGVAAYSLGPRNSALEAEHLMEVNKEWRHYLDATSKKIISFSNENERIRFHLLKVEALLRGRTTEHLSVSQQLNRSEMLDMLHQYTLEMKFSNNIFHSQRQPYFIEQWFESQKKNMQKQ